MESPPAAEAAERARKVARLAQFLDSSVRIPGTRITLGADSILGLLPWVGDAAGIVLGAVLVHQAAQAGAPRPLVRRMAWNVALDGLIGLVPVVGDVFDIFYKSNRRNAALLLRHLDAGAR